MIAPSQSQPQSASAGKAGTQPAHSAYLDALARGILVYDGKGKSRTLDSLLRRMGSVVPPAEDAPPPPAGPAAVPPSDEGAPPPAEVPAAPGSEAPVEPAVEPPVEREVRRVRRCVGA